MSIKRTDSQMTTCIAMVEIDGERRQAASASCSIRPGKGMNLSIDVVEGVEVPEEDMTAVAEMFREYVVDELKKARGLDIPI